MARYKCRHFAQSLLIFSLLLGQDDSLRSAGKRANDLSLKVTKSNSTQNSEVMASTDIPETFLQSQTFDLSRLAFFLID